MDDASPGILFVVCVTRVCHYDVTVCFSRAFLRPRAGSLGSSFKGYVNNTLQRQGANAKRHLSLDGLWDMEAGEQNRGHDMYRCLVLVCSVFVPVLTVCCCYRRFIYEVPISVPG